MLHQFRKAAAVASPASTSHRLLDVLWGAHFVSPPVFALFAVWLGVSDAGRAQELFVLPYVSGALTAIAAIVAHVMWRRWSPDDLPIHRARARAADLPILRVRLVQVWALDSIGGLFGVVLAFLGFPKDLWIWVMVASEALLCLHHPAHLRLRDMEG